MEFAEVSTRGAKSEDVGSIYELVVDSTDGKTTLTAAKLHNDLFSQVHENLIDIKNKDPSIQIDPRQFKTNARIANCFVAEVESKLIGYLIWHHHYSPWKGNYAFLDDIYVLPEYRRQGIARKLIDELFDVARSENLVGMFVLGSANKIDLFEHLTKCKADVYRNDDMDWDVLRIKFR